MHLGIGHAARHGFHKQRRLGRLADPHAAIPGPFAQIDDAFVVPSSALVALAEGGYAIEVITSPATATAPAQTTLIPVEPTLYSDGRVVMTGDQVTAGAEVVVPS